MKKTTPIENARIYSLAVVQAHYMSHLNTDGVQGSLESFALLCKNESEAEKLNVSLMSWFASESGFVGINVAVVAISPTIAEIRIICTKVGQRFSDEIVVEDVKVDSLSTKLSSINFKSPHKTCLLVGWIEGQSVRCLRPSDHERYAILESISFHRRD